MNTEIFEQLNAVEKMQLHSAACDPALEQLLFKTREDTVSEMSELDPQSPQFTTYYTKLQLRKQLVEDFKEFLMLVREFNQPEE